MDQQVHIDCEHYSAADDAWRDRFSNEVRRPSWQDPIVGRDVIVYPAPSARGKTGFGHFPDQILHPNLTIR